MQMLRVRGKDISDEDILKLTNIVIAYDLFYDFDDRSRVDYYLWVLIEDLDIWNKFPFGTVAYSRLIDGLHRALDEDRLMTGRNINLYGFIWAFQWWLVEMFLWLENRVGKRVIGGDVVLPRCVNWTCNSRKKIRWFNELDRLIGESRTLEPTDAEKEKDYWKSFNPEHLVRENAYKVGGGGAVDEARDDDSNNEERERELNREEEGERESNREEECVRESNREDESETESTREEEEEEQYHYHIPDPRVDSESTYLETRTKRAHEFRQGEDQHDDTPVPRDCSVAPGPSQRQEPQTKVGKIMALLESILKTQQEQNKRLSKIERMLKIHVPPDGGNDPNDDDDDDDDYDDDDDTESSIRNEYIHCSLPPKRASPLKTAPSPKRQYSVDVLVRH